jgi:hypothetical protein
MKIWKELLLFLISLIPENNHILKRVIHAAGQISMLMGALYLLLTSPDASAIQPLSTGLPVSDPFLTNDTLFVDSIAQPAQTRAVRKTIPQPRPVIASDTVPEKEEKQKRIPLPQRAVILSAVLPGLGQAYNGSYWKIPIIYGLGAGLYYFYDIYQDKFEEARILLEEGKINGLINSQLIRYEQERDYYAKWRNYCLIGIGVVYMANIVEAMTDAYFKQYDISDDLSFRISPAIVPEPLYVSSGLNLSYGVTINFQFK